MRKLRVGMDWIARGEQDDSVSIGGWDISGLGVGG